MSNILDKRSSQLKKTISKLRKSFEIEEKNKYTVPIFKKALLYAEKIAIKDARDEYSYLQLYVGAKRLSTQISNICGSGASSHVAHVCSKSVLWPIAQWACWMSGQVSMPLRSNLPIDAIKIAVQDAKSKLIISTPEYEAITKTVAEQLDIALIIIDHNFVPKESATHSTLERLLLTTGDHIMVEGTFNNDFYFNATAILLQTAGTTGTPKGVVISHKNLANQINQLSKIWHITGSDILLHVLPLNNVQGYANALMGPLSNGAKIILHDDHSGHNIWDAMLGVNVTLKNRANVFMGVPSIYRSLIAEYEQSFAKSPHMVEYISNFCKTHFRLMVSGSAPLPINIFNRWRVISRHNILEHYDLAETGMVLSNPYFENEKRKRQPGLIGMPLPEVSVRLISPDNEVLLACHGGLKNEIWSQTLSQSANEGNTEISAVVGELCVAGPTVFQGYLNRSNESECVFVDDYFKTGDMVAYENSSFKILGRIGVDIIKIDGHIVSCLEIETLVLTHPHVKDVAILGVPHNLWQDLTYAICVLKPGKELDFSSLKSFCADSLPTYKLPRVLKLVNDIPRDEMDKINKKQLFEIHFVPK